MRCIIYTRVSTQDQDAKQQVDSCVELAKVKGFSDDEIEVLSENISAWKYTTRSLYNQMLDKVYAKEVNAIIVWHYDRLSRNYKVFFNLMRELYLVYGVRVYSVQQGWLDELYDFSNKPEFNNIPEPYGSFLKGQLKLIWDLLVGIVGRMSEDESTKKSERIKKAYAYKKKHHPKTYKWGRPKISKYLSNKIIELYEGKIHYSINQISKQVKTSYGTTWSVIKNYEAEKQQLKAIKEGVSQKD